MGDEQWIRHSQNWAKCLHCVRTACALHAQRLGYSPKNTCHLFTRGKTERCQYHRVGQVSVDTSGCRYNQQHRRRRTVRSWCRLATIEYRRSRAFGRLEDICEILTHGRRVVRW